MNKQDVERLAQWSDPKEVQTKYGPRILRKAAVTERFSEAWKTHKAEIKALGAGFGKTQAGDWELSWWQELSSEVKAQREQSLVDSKAVAADVELPHPEGLDYMPFQKAGIKFALSRTHVLFGDEMGLGKTIQAIGVINADPEIKSVLIICPKSLKLNWQRELERWLVRPSLILIGSTKPDTQLLDCLSRFAALNNEVRLYCSQQSNNVSRTGDEPNILGFGTLDPSVGQQFSFADESAKTGEILNQVAASVGNGDLPSSPARNNPSLPIDNSSDVGKVFDFGGDVHNRSASSVSPESIPSESSKMVSGSSLSDVKGSGNLPHGFPLLQSLEGSKQVDVSYTRGSGHPIIVLILNYDVLSSWQPVTSIITYDAAICDEAHLIKNAKTKRSRIVKAIKARRHLRLTGTPIVNRPVELYNLISDMGEWGSFFSFARRYAQAHNNGYGWDFSGAANLDELQRRLRETIMVRRLKSEVLTELPRKIRQVVLVEAETPAQRAAVRAEQKYEAASDNNLAALRSEAEKAKDQSEELYKQAVDNLNEAFRVRFEEMARLAHDTSMAKVPAVIAHIENALEDNEDKIVIFAHHLDVIAGLKRGLDDRPNIRKMDGGINRSKQPSRNEDVDGQVSMWHGEIGVGLEPEKRIVEGLSSVSPDEARSISDASIPATGAGEGEGEEARDSFRANVGGFGISNALPIAGYSPDMGEQGSSGEYSIYGQDRSIEGVREGQRVGDKLESQRDQEQRDARRARTADLKSSDKIAIITGGSNEAERQDAVDRFQNDPRCRIFIGNITAAGVGITLTASSYVVFAELDWVPGNMSQAEDRCHRIGQTETVLVQHIVLDQSLDARQAKVLIAKQQVIDEGLDKDHPAPVYPERPEPKPEAPKPLKAVQPDLPAEVVEAVHQGLRLLAGMDSDYARELNGIGFNKIDGGFGHKLAELSSLTSGQAAAGLKLIKKYRGQLPEELRQALGIGEKPKKKAKKIPQVPPTIVLMLVAGL